MRKTVAPILSGICLFLAVPALAADKTDAKDVQARIKLVRQMYEKLPPGVLGISEPVEVVIWGSRTSWIITLRDRDKKTYEFTWWRAGHISGPKEERLKECGPEESALYGALLRFHNKQEAKGNLRVVDLLKRLDTRFAERPSIKE